MNNLQQIISQERKEFEEKFDFDMCEQCGDFKIGRTTNESIRSHIDLHTKRVVAQAKKETIEDVLEIISGMGKELPRRFDCPDCVELNKELDTDDRRCAICNGERGFNSALSHLESTVSEVIKKI